MTELARILLLGCGYTGLEVARQARAKGLRVMATTRDDGHADQLSEAGAAPLVLKTLSAEVLAPYVDAGTGIIVTFPPDGQTDAACAALARQAFASAYVSSTGVYGDIRGVVDDATQPAPDSERNKLRLVAEQHWRDAGATILRTAAIYGTGRGQHTRVRSGSARIAGDGAHHVSRIHVVDLARVLLRTIELQLGPRTHVLGDDEPATQGEVIRYLAELMGVPTPASVPLEAAPETLRHDRKVDPTGIKRATGMAWLYPSYRVGFPAALAEEAALSGEAEPLA